MAKRKHSESSGSSGSSGSAGSTKATEEPRRKQAKRGVKGQIHTCGLCGSTDHREEQCPTPAGARVRALKKRIAELEGAKAKRKGKGLKSKARVAPRSTGQHKKLARMAYSTKKEHGLHEHRKYAVRTKQQTMRSANPKRRWHGYVSTRLYRSQASVQESVVAVDPGQNLARSVVRSCKMQSSQVMGRTRVT